MLVKVRDRKTGVERTVTQKAYAAMGPKVYEKLGFVDENGQDVGSPNRNTPQVQQVSRSVKSAGPVVVRTQLVAPVVTSDTEQEEQAEQSEPVKERRKPGPKPKNLAAPKTEKSISSNSDENEQ